MPQADPTSPTGPSRLRTALRGSVYYLGSNTTGRVLFLIALPFVTRAISVEVFAQYALARVLLAALDVLAGLGTDSALVRFARESGAARAADDRWATCNWTRILAGTVLGAALVAATPWLGPPLGLEDATHVAMLIAATVIASEASVGLSAGLRAREKHGIVAATATVGAFARVGGIFAFVVFSSGGLEGLLLAGVLGEFAHWLLLLPFAGRAPWRAPRFDLCRKLVRFGFPVSLSFLVSALGALDRWLIRAVAPLGSVGGYQLASMPRAVVEVVEVATLSAFEPYVYGSDRADAGPRLERLVRVFATVAICASAITSLVGPEVLAIVAPPDYGFALPIIPWMLFAGVADAIFRLVGMASGLALRTRPWAFASVAQLAMMGALVLPLASTLGAEGAGIGRFAAAFLGMVLCELLSRNVSPIRFASLRITGAVAVGALASSFAITSPLIVRLGVAVAIVLGCVALLLWPAPRRRA